MAPAIRASVITDLIAGGPEAVQTLRQMARGEIKAEPARVNACVALLDRVGFTPRPSAPLQPDDAATTTDKPIEEMTMDEVNAEAVRLLAAQR